MTDLFLSAVGEPPLTLSSSVLLAVKRAMESVRADAGNTEFFSLYKMQRSKCFFLHPLTFLILFTAGPATVENIQRCCLVDPAVQFSF